MARKKRTLRYQSRIHSIDKNCARTRAIEAPELLLMMETLSRWVCYDHRHKTFLSKELLWLAARTMNLRADRTHWSLHRDWPLYAFMIGIDLHTFTVIDPIKFGWFWYQLGETGKFSIKWQKELINSGKEPPELSPLIITKPYLTDEQRAQRVQKKVVKQAGDNYMKEEIINHFFV